MKTRMQLLQDDLDNDPYECELNDRANKFYQAENRKKARKEKRHRADRQYRGETNERLFSDYLDYLVESGHIPYAKWLSYHEKSEYDFMVQLKDARYIYIDVVGTQMRNTTVMLNCSHKDYKSKLKASQGSNGYLAFILNGKWRFLQISRHLPAGDISMTKGRNKHVKKPSFLFKCDSLSENCPEKDKNPYSKFGRTSVNMQHSDQVI